MSGFVGYLQDRGIAHVTVEATLAWIIAPAQASPTWR